MGELNITNLSFAYGQNNILSNLNLSIPKGEFFTLLGPSGCGKTTLLKLIAGFLKPQQGTIFLDGKNITELSSSQRDIGTVFQNYALFPHLNVEENIAFGLKIRNFSLKAIHEKVNDYLALVNLVAYKKKQISELSGGQQQRVALIRSLIVEPKVLLLDEPMSNLDVTLREEMCAELKRIQKALKITTVFVTHNQEEALAVSDRVALMNNGVFQQIAPPEEIYKHPINAFTAAFLGKINILPADFMSSYGLKNLPSQYIRPEQIQLYTTPRENSVPATIESIAFMGSLITYRCLVDKVVLTVTTLSSSAPTFHLHDKVYLHF